MLGLVQHCWNKHCCTTELCEEQASRQPPGLDGVVQGEAAAICMSVCPSPSLLCADAAALSGRKDISSWQTTATFPIWLVMMQEVQGCVLVCWWCREMGSAMLGLWGHERQRQGWNWLPLWDSMGFCNSSVSSLEVLQARLDGALSNLM